MGSSSFSESFSPPGPHPDPLPSDGRGDSDWMILVICEQVVRDTGHGGLETGSRARMRP